MAATNDLPIYGGNIEQNYQSTFDFLKPNVALEVSKKYGDGIKAVDILRCMGKYQPVDRDSWSVYEETFFHRTITLHQQSTDSTDSNGVICWEFYPSAADLADVTNGYANYYRVGFHVLVPLASEGVAIGRIDSIENNGSAAGTVLLNVTPMDLTKTPAGNVIASGTEMAIVGSSFGAGTAQPKSVSQGWLKRTFYAQILKETTKAEGTQLVNNLWVKKFEDGGKIVNWYHPEFARTEARLDIYEEGMILFGEVSDATNIVSTTNTNGDTDSEGVGNHMTTSQGLFSWNTSLGSEQTYADNNWSVDELDPIEDHLRDQGVNSGIILHMVGHKFKRQVDNAGLDIISATAAGDALIHDYLSQKGTKELAVQLGFSCIERSGFKHIFQVVDSFSNPQTYGASGYNINKWALTFPVSKIPVQVDGKRLMVPNVSMRYRAMNGYSRKRELWVNGAAGGSPARYIGEHDMTRTFWRSHLGLQALKMNQSISSKPA